eukprot:g20885.t1
MLDVRDRLPSLAGASLLDKDGLIFVTGDGVVLPEQGQIEDGQDTFVVARPKTVRKLDEVSKEPGHDSNGSPSAPQTAATDDRIASSSSSTTTRTARINDSDGSGESSNTTGSDGGSGNGNCSGGSSSGVGGAGISRGRGGRYSWNHPGNVLRPGEKMTGVLMSPDETSGVFVDTDDGSLMFLRVPGKTDGDADGFEMPVLEPLIKSNPRQVAKVKRIRQDTFDEMMETTGRGGEEEEEEERGLGKALMGFLPFGKNGLVGRSRREKARRNWGQVYFTMTDRGEVESYMDGRRVLRRQAPSFFGLRPKSDQYEVLATNEGLDQQRAGTHQSPSR